MPAKKLRHCLITVCNETNADFMELYRIFTATLCPHMPFRVFRAFYESRSLEYIDVTFIYENDVTVGFCAAAFYTSTINNAPVVIGRAATGILPEHRGGGLPHWALYSKYMRYKFWHPLASVILTIYVANPLIYAMICKYTGIVYPSMKVDASGKIQEIKRAVLRSSGLQDDEIRPFVTKIHFQVQLGKDIIQRIMNSENIYVKHYLAINPKFQEQYGVLTIVPVNWENIFRSACKLIKGLLFKKVDRKGNRPEPPLKKKTGDQKMLNFHGRKYSEIHAEELPGDPGK